jgi:hypothetical protein
MTRLETIVRRERTMRLRDLLFAGTVAIAAIVGVTSVRTACAAATTTTVHVAQR